MRLLGWGPTRPKYHCSIKINFLRYFCKTFLLVSGSLRNICMRIRYFVWTFCNDVLKQLFCTSHSMDVMNMCVYDISHVDSAQGHSWEVWWACKGKSMWHIWDGFCTHLRRLKPLSQSLCSDVHAKSLNLSDIWLVTTIHRVLCVMYVMLFWGISCAY